MAPHAFAESILEKEALQKPAVSLHLQPGPFPMEKISFSTAN